MEVQTSTGSPGLLREVARKMNTAKPTVIAGIGVLSWLLCGTEGGLWLHPGASEAE